MSKRVAPAAERNRQPILEVLAQVLPDSGTILEIASGTGQHAAYFAEYLPQLRWQPSDPSPEARESITSWVAATGRHNLLAPLALDVRARPWPVDGAAAVLCINMIHIAPWDAAVALFEGAATVLDEGHPLVTYGPYRAHGEHTAPSNQAFDLNLRSRDPSWGVRDLDELGGLAHRTGFRLEKRFEMPANNMTLVWVREA